MSQQQQSYGSVVRRAVRHDVALRAKMSVHPDHAQAVRLSQSSGVRDGWLDCDIVDVSGGGIGIMTHVFLPKRTKLNVRVFGLAAGGEPLMEIRVAIQRVVMTDRRPAYILGATFDHLTAEQGEKLKTVLEMIASEN